MRAVLIIAGVLLVFGLVAFSGKLISGYQQLNVERSDIDARWTQLDKDMQQKAELVRAFADTTNSPEASDAKAARAELLASKTREEKMKADIRLTSALDRARARNVVSDQNLEDQLEDVQEDLSNDRENYNDAIKKYNTDLQLFPRNIVAAIFHFQRDDAYYPTPPGANQQ